MEVISLSELPGMEENDAVLVSSAYKMMGTRGYALRGLDMAVKQGTIYGLLGPSGCGKTTLLSCLVGSSKLDGGTITMKINQTSQIGYMPQNLALFQEFTIKEHLLFYGFIHNMNRSQIIEESEKLKDFLELPKLDTIISTLSGGQQRRVSLCIAFLHNPDVLILDEPTVGIDVVLSASIWDKLVEMSTVQKKTIIITTHYIQEARRSNTIGLMRNGKILAEDDPHALMRAHNTSSLEDVFLKLCRQEFILNDYGDEDPDKSKLQLTSNYRLFDRKLFKWNRVFAYTLKSVTWMRRNIPLVLFTLMLPIVQCTLISVAVGEDPRGLKFGVVNDEIMEEFGPLSDVRECGNSTLSGEFLSILHKKGTYLVAYPNLKTAHEAVKKNNVWGVVYFNQNYSSYLHERMAKGVKTENEAVDGSQVQVWLDMSNYIIGNFMKEMLKETTMELLDNVIMRCNFTTTHPGRLTKVEAVYGTLHPSFRQFMTPANAVLFAFYLPMMFTLGAMLMEKTSGLLQRTLVAGLTLLEVTIGHVILQMAILVAQTALMMVVLYCVFDNPLIHSTLAWCFVFLLFVGICGMFYGLLVAAICDSFTTASCLAIGSYFPLFMLSGAIWPLEGIYPFLRVFSNCLPVTSAVEAYRSISVRSWGLAQMNVYTSIISLTLWTSIFGILAALLIKWRGTNYN